MKFRNQLWRFEKDGDKIRKKLPVQHRKDVIPSIASQPFQVVSRARQWLHVQAGEHDLHENAAETCSRLQTMSHKRPVLNSSLSVETQMYQINSSCEQIIQQNTPSSRSAPSTVCALAEHSSPHPGTAQNSCSAMFWDVLGCSGMYQLLLMQRGKQAHCIWQQLLSPLHSLPCFFPVQFKTSYCRVLLPNSLSQAQD